MGDPPTAGEPELARYLQLPAEMPARVARARGGDHRRRRTRRTSGRSRSQSWLQANTEYDLDVAREPDGRGRRRPFPVRRRGAGSASTSRARWPCCCAPPGSRRGSPRASDPGSGTRSRATSRSASPTPTRGSRCSCPGSGGCRTTRRSACRPPSRRGRAGSSAPEVLAAIGRAVAGVVPPSVRSAVADAVRSAGGRRAGRRPGPRGAPRRGHGRRARRRRGATAPAERDPGPPDDVGRAFEELVAALGHAGHPRAPSATPREYLAEVTRTTRLDGETRTARVPRDRHPGTGALRPARRTGRPRPT